MPYKDREVRLAYLRRYREAHREHLAELDRRRTWDEKRGSWEAWVAANPERRAAINARANKRYTETHREAVRAKVALRRARVMAVFVEKVDRLVVFDRDGGICGICHRPADRENFHLDHIVALSRGGEHSYANTQVAHPSCNHRKRHLPQAIAEARLNGTQRGLGLSA